MEGKEERKLWRERLCRKRGKKPDRKGRVRRILVGRE